MTREEAYALRRAMVAGAASLDDQTASTAPKIFDRMQYDGALIPAGTRIHWLGSVKRAAVDLWDREENSPDAAPALWEDIGYRAGYRIIPETITAGAAFAEGECGWWKNVLYRSLIGGNVWTPDAYPSGWEVVG